MRHLLDRLHDEWKYLVPSPEARRALIRWGEDPALTGFADLDALLGEVQRRHRPVESDRMLLALLRRASSDPVAARTVLAAIMPGLKSLMSAYRLTGEPEEVAAAVVEAAFERIQRYPCDRRPERVAANLVLDTRQSLWRAACRERRVVTATVALTDGTEPLVAPPDPQPGATAELIDLVTEAVRLGHLDRPDARLILLTRVLDLSAEELAHEMGVPGPTLRKRRQRAEAALTVMRPAA